MSRHNILLISAIWFLLILLWSCKEENQKVYHKIEGKTMGTTYHITFDGANPEAIQTGVDSLLKYINLSMSTYIDSSTISRINKADSMYCYAQKDDPHFSIVFEKSAEVKSSTSGAFDPSIMPLVNYYGFGYTEKKKVEKADTTRINELLALLRFDEISLSGPDEKGMICITKPAKGVQLDFSAIAKGYGVDKVGEYLESNGIRNYMVEIGGEVRALGLNDKNKEWVIGINRPSEDASPNEIELPIKISNRAVATSGNYRNAYESKGKRFAHIIDPKTGFSRPTDILSATVIAKDCMTADAYATAFMVMGIEKSLELIEQLNDMEACFLYDLEGDGVFEFKISSGFSNYLLHNEQK
ncbi:MAG: FAD:protein FMN transferase [Saprospiraceae bacterium]|nr:FAD:protein FMN transferase [Saprospiraceae bacterium]